MKKPVKTYIRYPRRKIDGPSIAVPDQSLSIRTLVDRVSKGLPINSKMRQHVPLPPDGMIDYDFESGTEEILDVTDAVEHIDKIQSEQRYIQEQKEKARKEALGQVDPLVPTPDNENK